MINDKSSLHSTLFLGKQNPLQNTLRGIVNQHIPYGQGGHQVLEASRIEATIAALGGA